MFGAIYFIWALISDLGYHVKETIYNIQAKPTEDGTYYGLDGKERDVKTGKVVTWVKNDNGDSVLWDKPGHVYRNLSSEKRAKEFGQAREKWKENSDGPTVYTTNQRRQISFKDENGNNKSEYGMIYRDLKTGKEYAARFVTTRYKEINNGREYVSGDPTIRTSQDLTDSKNIKTEEMEFYCSAINPYNLVRITDRQVEREKQKEKYGGYSWVKHPEDERTFVKEYNTAPIKMLTNKDSYMKFT